MAEGLLISQPKISHMGNCRRAIKPVMCGTCAASTGSQTRGSAHHPARPFRLWAVLDQSALRRRVASPKIMCDQVAYLNHLGAQPQITVQVLQREAGAHPGVSGRSSILGFPGAATGTVHPERFTSDLSLEKRSDVQHYGLVHNHLQAQALTPEDTRDFITHAAEVRSSLASRWTARGTQNDWAPSGLWPWLLELWGGTTSLVWWETPRRPCGHVNGQGLVRVVSLGCAWPNAARSAAFSPASAGDRDGLDP
ncbi:DUF5753 domain-containing protein [Streptomyces sp. NPDC020817]|uniref:DUF5753 domain-containing protein n=1 Tax=Streptomyces sp. NPDC020817 TaxID=3365095 RepID=UPI00378FEBEB